jgi:acetolactate synthase-1/2/3 large subunit
MSNWVRTSTSPSDLAAAGAESVAAAQIYPGQIATIIAPGDHAWTDGAAVSPAGVAPEVPRATDREIAEAAALISKPGPAVLFVGGRALREEALFQAGRIAAATGARIVSETSPARLQRGAGRLPVQRLPYFAEMAVEFFEGTQQIVFIGARPPVSFFAYPGKPSWLSPESAELCELADPRTDAEDTLRRLADALNAPAEPEQVQEATSHTYEEGKLTARSAGIITAQLLPENAIVSDEGVSSGAPFHKYTAGAAKHDWLTITGGAIGQGLPLATGAAVACPDRKVIALEADGSGMYTVQALWTMARENLDVTTIILKNNSYGILNIELDRVGVSDPGPKALSLLDLSNPILDWVSMSEGMGVPASRAETTQQFHDALAGALADSGPRLIEAVLT